MISHGTKPYVYSIRGRLKSFGEFLDFFSTVIVVLLTGSSWKSVMVHNGCLQEWKYRRSVTAL